MITEWAHKWRISHAAMHELKELLGALSEPAPTYADATTEAGVQQRERLEMSRAGGRLWRNNVGAWRDPDTGAVVRYGLCNDSTKVNKVIKSSDLIGIKPVVITEDMVGRMIGQFIARETKKPGWKYTGTEREAAQLKFLTLITSLGGDARFIS